MPFFPELFHPFVRGAYEKIRDFGGSDITPVGGAIITDLAGILSTDAISTDVVKSVEFPAVSSHHCAGCNFRSPTATGYPRIPGKQE